MAKVVLRRVGVSAAVMCVLCLGVCGDAAFAGVDGPPVCPPTETDRLFALDAMPLDEFAFDLAIDGDTAAVSAILAPRDEKSATGAVYVYKRVDGFWLLEAKLLPDDGRDGDRFGTSVALDGDTLIVGSPLKDGPNGEDEGQAYIYERRDAEWGLVARLTLPDLGPEALFGNDVDISGIAAIVGAPGVADATGGAFIFERGDGGVWDLKWTLQDPSPGMLQAFGESVAIDDNTETAAVGARFVPGDAGPQQGAVHVYTRQPQGWLIEATLRHSPANGQDTFGWPIGLEKDRVIAGAPQASGNSPFTGAAYVFERDEGVWSQKAKLAASDGTFLDYFGYSVAIDDDVAVVGALFDSGPAGLGQGSAYFFRRVNGVWGQYSKFVPPDAAANNFLGRSAVVRDGQALIGSYLFQGEGYVGDTAYVLDLGGDTAAIAAGPIGLTVTAGERAEFRVQAQGTPPFVYQWRRDGAVIGSGPRYFGQGSDSFTIAPALESDAGSYSVTVTNYCGGVTSAAVLLQVLPCVRVNTQPASQVVPFGTVVTFGVEASGADGLSYRWLFNGQELQDGVYVSGAQSPSLRVGPARQTESGRYSVRITAGCGTTTSAEATLVVRPQVCVGDANRDGMVNFADVTSVLSTLGATFGDSTGWGDATGDGVVNFNDVTFVLANMGVACQ